RWGIGPLISWTIPGGLEYARIEIAKAGAEAALAHFDGAVLGALRDTETALAVYARELDRNASLRTARKDAAEAARQVETLYLGGRAPYINDLDARRNLTSADAALAVSDSQLALDQVNLFLALGGGWEQASNDKQDHPAKTAGHH
ncbi:MAG: TolC family protein, partial [Rhodocyclaceae bacterium]